MRLILTTLILLFTIFAAKAQTPVFTFECFKNANMTGDSCDICTGTVYKSRSFNGLMVYRLGVFNKWIDEPYLIRVRPGESVEFIEQIGGSNPDKITIPLSQTGFSTVRGFIDSTFCEGAIFDFGFSISDSLRTTAVSPFDTISIVGRGGTTVTLDTVTHKYIVESASGGGGGATNLTYTGTTSPVTLNSSTGTDVTITGGAGIGLGATSTALTITATDPSITNETNTSFSVVSGALQIVDPNSTLSVPVTTIAPDQSATNELQNLSLAGQALGITSGTGVSLPIVGVSAGTGIGVSVSSGIATVTNTGDLSNTNELNTSFSVIGPNLQISDANGSLTVSVTQIAPDQSITNEAQTLTSGTNTLTLSTAGGAGGGTVTVDTNPSDDITGSGAVDQITFFNGAQTVTGSSRFTLNNSASAGIIINGGDGAAGSGSFAQFRKDGTNTLILGSESALFGGTGMGSAIFQYNDNPMFFCTNSAKRATLLGNGNFGLNTTNPLSLLHVNGAARITGSGGQATSITGRDANNDITNVTLGSGLSLSLGTLSASAPTNTWLLGGNTLTATGVIGSNSNHALELETNGVTKVHIATDGKVGIGSVPLTSLDLSNNADGILLPSGTNATRATVGGALRRNGGSSALEWSNNSTDWTILTSGNTPVQTVGNGIGTAPTFTVLSGSSIFSGRYQFTVGTAPQADGKVFSYPINSGLFTHIPTATVFAGNKQAASDIAKFYTTETLTEVAVFVNGTLTAGATYIIKVQVQN